MWKLSSTITQKMDGGADEIAVEATAMELLHGEDDQRVPEDGDDESSIEALTWSDFDEEELEIAKELAEKEFPMVPQLKDSLTSTSTITTSQNSEGSYAKDSDDSPSSVVSISSSQLLDIDSVSDITEICKSVTEEENDRQIMDGDGALSNCGLSATSIDGDKSSNAAVLDDGPIWGKGAKSYKFHENQKINQKLTFGVFISVVLAIGIGLGNLVAYNEYEGEFHKPMDHQHCPIPIRMDTPPMKNTLFEKNVVSPPSTDYPSPSIQNVYSASSDRVDVHTETLAQVVKSIDELSKKIDQFQNTTRQLSGIIVMNDALKTTHKVPEKMSAFPKHNTLGHDEFSKFLPTFNDDLSSWERSNGQNLKFDDPTCPPKSNHQKTQFSNGKLKVGGCEKLPVQNRSPSKQAEKTTIDDDVQIKDENVKNSDTQGREYDKIHLKIDDSQIQQEKKVQKKQKSKEKTLTNEKDKKKKKDWDKKLGKDEKENNYPQNEEMKVKKEKKKILKREKAVDTEQVDENKKYTKKNEKDKKVKKDKWVEKEPEKQKKFDESEGKSKKEKKKHLKTKIESHDQVVRGKPEKLSGPGEGKVKKDSERKHKKDPKDNSYFHNNESLPERHIKQHKVKRNINKENPEGRTNYHLGEYSDVNERRRVDKPSSKYPKYNNKVDKNDWSTERAKFRENQRVQQNWNSDFNSEDQAKIKRKRSQNWQIERDRVREKIRKVDNS